MISGVFLTYFKPLGHFYTPLLGGIDIEHWLEVGKLNFDRGHI